MSRFILIADVDPPTENRITKAIQAERVLWSHWHPSVWLVVDRHGRDASWWSRRAREVAPTDGNVVVQVDSPLFSGFMSNEEAAWMFGPWQGLESNAAPVIASGIPVFSDPECRNRVEGVTALLLRNSHLPGHTIVPTSRTDYRPGDVVAVDWDFENLTGPAWYQDEESHEANRAWGRTCIFTGNIIARHLAAPDAGSGGVAGAER